MAKTFEEWWEESGLTPDQVSRHNIGKSLARDAWDAGIASLASDPPTGPTAHVHIAVAVDPTGDWSAVGWRDATAAEAMGSAIDTLETGERRFWLEADLPIPKKEADAVKATVTEAAE